MKSNYQLYNDDCRNLIKGLAGSYDVIITDPPYPDIEKDFEITAIDFLDEIPCRQFIFWSAIEPFPFDYTAIHIWHKPNGNSSQHYERIFERNGQRVCKVFRVAAILPNYNQYKAECVNHPTQKPLKLMRQLVRMCKPNEIIFDPFMGSGSTGEASMQENHPFIGIEKRQDYFAIAQRRLANHQPPLFIHVEERQPNTTWSGQENRLPLT